MNQYRSYFDRVKVSNTLHQRLLSGERAEKRRSPALVRYGSMAACLALICLAGFGVWRWNTPQMGGDITAGDSLIPGEKDTYGPGETPPVLATATPVPTEEPYAPTLTFTDRTNEPEPAASIAWPQGYFMLPLTEADCLKILGFKMLPWELEPYKITGETTYDGEGQIWQVTIQAVSDEDADRTFSIRMAPDRLPPECVVYEVGEKNEIDGVSVQADYFIFDRDGDGEDEYVSRTSFMSGDMGVRVDVVDHADTRDAAEGVTRKILQYSTMPDPISPEEIPKWRSEALTHDQARVEEGLGTHIPGKVPSRFRFESAWRELGQNRDWLSISWSSGYDYIDVTVYRAEFYPQADSDDPPLLDTEMTDDLLIAQFDYVDSDAGDVPGYRARFAVDYGDGFIVNYNFKGVTPEEAARVMA